jgi:hypothetical protein
MTTFITVNGKALVHCPNCGAPNGSLLVVTFHDGKRVKCCDRCSRQVVYEHRRANRSNVINVLENLK